MSEVRSIKQLSSGYWHIRGYGPYEWAQPVSWPCTSEELERSFFPEASRDFRVAVRKAMEDTP